MRYAFVLPLVFLICSGSAHAAEVENWSGLWARENADQCKCNTYVIGPCPAGNGLPPILITEEKFIGPEIDCIVNGIVGKTENSFKFDATCSSEGTEETAFIVGDVENSTLSVTVRGNITNYWGQGDYTSFKVKCTDTLDAGAASKEKTENMAPEFERKSSSGNDKERSSSPDAINDGSYVSKKGESVPQFPSSVRGFYSAPGKDFWGKPFQEKGSIRVFEGGDWIGIPDFPYTQNGCSNGRFMVRWRAENTDLVVTASLGFAGNVIEHPINGIQGYIIGSNCHQPLFKISGKINSTQSTRTDLYYEVRFWRAGVD